MNLSKLAIPLFALLVFTWVARGIWESPAWSLTEDLALGLFAVIVAVKIIQDSKKSNLEKKACSKLIEQISVVLKPNMNKMHPFWGAEITGWLIGCAAIYLMVFAALKINR